eukprot:scaffold2456_cov171-Skeletonema_dohrnii-CCMP3373.AAC.1
MMVVDEMLVVAVVSKASEPLGEGEVVIVVVVVDLVMIECGGGMIDCHVIGRAQPRPVDGSYCIKRSVFSEAFLVGVEWLVYQLSCSRFIRAVNFCEFDRRENEAANLLVVNMVLIDRD